MNKKEIIKKFGKGKYKKKNKYWVCKSIISTKSDMFEIKNLEKILDDWNKIVIDTKAKNPSKSYRYLYKLLSGLSMLSVKKMSK